MTRTNAALCLLSRRRSASSLSGRSVSLPLIAAAALLTLLSIERGELFAQTGLGAEVRPAAQPYVDRGETLSLQRARECFESGRTIEGVEHLQRVFDAPADSFVPAGDQYTGARNAALSLLRSLPPSVHRVYQTIKGPLAGALLREALEKQDLNLLRMIARRFPSTDPQFRAVHRLATVAFDRGDFGTAARLWSDLLADPQHAERITPDLIAKTIVALRRSGSDGRASEFAVQYSSLTVPLAGQRIPIGSLLSRLPPLPESTATAANPTQSSPGLTPPAFPPAWHFASETANQTLAELWAASRRSDARPAAVAAGAVVVGDHLIVREPGGLAAHDLATGSVAWRMPLSASASEFSGGRTADLHSLTRFEELYAANGVLGGLSTDGHRLFVVDRNFEPGEPTRTASRSPVPAYEQRPEGDNSNRLLAIPVAGGEKSIVEPAWTVGGTDSHSNELVGHFFFGPPAVTHHCLLAITEQQQRLNLVALDPETGQLNWQQPLGFVPRAVAGDPVRAASPCKPNVVDGIAVCETNAGFVVAVDVVTGRLLWSYDYSATEPVQRGSPEWSADRTIGRGELSLPSQAIVRGNRVYLLPQDSQRVHCVDLRTGEALWNVDRDQSYQIACVTDSLIVLAGRSLHRALSTAAGDELWTSRTGTPTGQGIVADPIYLVPVESGLIAAIDLRTGLRIGFDSPRSETTFEPLTGAYGSQSTDLTWQPGNLVAHQGSIYSIGPLGVTRLESARSLLESGPETIDLLETARIELAAGKVESARPRLEQLLSDDSHESTRREVRRLLRELHYLQLERQSGDQVASTLSELDRLSDSPETRARYLLAAMGHELRNDEDEAVRRAVAELSSLELAAPLPTPGDATHLVTAASWVPAMMRRLGSPVTPPLQSAVLATLDDYTLRRRLLCATAEEDASAIRLELARRAATDGDLHRAEMLILSARETGALASAASEQLVALRQQCGLDDFCPLDIESGPIEQVQIVGELWAPASEPLCRTFGRSRRGFLTRGEDSFRIVDRGDSRRARLAVVDLKNGVCLGEVAIDARLRFPSPSRQPRSGHFVPVATSERVFGVSMLEAHRNEPAWSIELPGRDGLLPQIGPYSASFCTVQTRRGLTVLDPETGATIWRRTELPPERGLHGDHSAGLFGDHEALVLLGGDGTSYTSFSTRTGELLAEGRLPIDQRRQRRAYGRKLFFVETAEGHSTARVWDSLTGQYDLEIDCQGTLLQTSTPDDQIVLLFSDRRLVVFDPERSVTAVDLVLPPHEAGRPHAIQAFSDADRYYISLYQSDPDRFEESRIANYVYDTPLSTTHVHGKLIAIDRATGEVVWSRPTDQRSILDPIEHPTPFLVAVARVNDRKLGSRKTLLVEAIDVETGATLGHNDVLFNDLLLQVRTDPAKQRVTIAGTTSTVVLNYGRHRRNRPAFAENDTIMP